MCLILSVKTLTHTEFERFDVVWGNPRSDSIVRVQSRTKQSKIMMVKKKSKWREALRSQNELNGCAYHENRPGRLLVHFCFVRNLHIFRPEKVNANMIIFLLRLYGSFFLCWGSPLVVSYSEVNLHKKLVGSFREEKKLTGARK